MTVHISCTFKCGRATLDLSGRFVVSSGETEIIPLRDAVQRLIAEDRQFVCLNLARLTSIDARGLGEFVHAFTTLRRSGGDLTLLAPTTTVRKLLAVTRLDQVLPICDEKFAEAAGFCGGAAEHKFRTEN